MKTKNLFPHAWKPFGWVLLCISILPGLWMLIDDSSFPLSLAVQIPWPFATESSGPFANIDLLVHKDGTVTLQLVDELLALGTIAGLMLVGFSRLKVEDERIAQLRLESLQWAIYGNTLVLVLCILFVHGLAFINVMVYNMFTPLLIFVLRFHWLLYIAPALEDRRERRLA
ncbi:hypothetical protein [Telluribacter humicola]|uniref:hypothetical protein n=1 Tax=Telluribacter humicola TaxID=1720261 RepID=UPI001A957431|nr:hypothetical protein [Telluribacter humicola]